MFEPVLTMTEYYDGPRRGIAEYGGKPHIYQSIWGPEWGELSDIDSDEFLLMPVDPETLALALEDWAIWRRKEGEFFSPQPESDPSSYGALPAERARREELAPLLEARLVLDPSRAVRRRGQFRRRDDPSCPLEVEWSDPGTAGPAVSDP